jgi:hypothetical protein
LSYGVKSMSGSAALNASFAIVRAFGSLAWVPFSAPA